MPRRAVAIVSALGFATVALAVALGVVLASDDDETSDTFHGQATGYPGMMAAMATMDSGAMLERMREILGEDGYQAMLQHMQDHRNGTAGSMGPGVDGMIHQMMDGMMSMMPADADGYMFPNDQMPMPMSGMPGNR